MKYGVTKDGFIRKDFEAIRLEKQNYLKDNIGQLNFNAPSVIGQLIDLAAYFEAQSWMLAESVYNNMYIDSAEGIALDRIAENINITRLLPTYSTALCQVTTENNILLPAGSKINIENTNITFSLVDQVQLNNTKCYAIQLKVKDNIQIGQAVSIHIDQHVYTYTVVENDDALAITNHLFTIITEANLYNAAVTTDGFLIITSKTLDTFFECYIDSNQISIESVTQNIIFVCDTFGKVSAPAFSLNTINTNVAGWISVNNQTPASEGRERETDAELRLRMSTAKIRGSGSLEAIKSRLQNLTGVLSVTAKENITLDVVDEIPAKSFEMLVLGGNDQDIAKEIWNSKPAGIATHGNQSVIITDSQNDQHTIKFSRAVKKYIYTKIVLTVTNKFDQDKSIPLMKSEVAALINSFGVGNTVLYQAIFKKIYLFAEIVGAVITIAGNLVEEKPDDNQFLAQNIAILSTQIPTSDLAKIEITLA